MCLALFVALPGEAQLACTQVYRVESAALETLRNHLTGVHMTDFLPTGGKIQTSLNSRGYPRQTLHFALGEMVRSHSFGNWEKMKYAILVPFRHLEPQLMNVFHQDTFILGDLTLKSGTILIAPQGESVPQIPGVKVQFFDPSTANIRDVIRDTLIKNKQWVFESESGYVESKVMFQGENVNFPFFFKSLFERYPHLTFGLHSEHPIFAVERGIETRLNAVTKGHFVHKDHYLEWQIALAELETKEAQLMPTLPAAVNENLRQQHAIFQTLFNRSKNLYRAEIALQKESGKTLLGTKLPKKLRKQILSLALNEPQLREFLTRNLDQLNSGKDEYEGAELYSQLNHLRQKMDSDQFSKFINTHPQVAGLVGGVDFQLKMKAIEEGLITPSGQRRVVELLREELRTCEFVACWSFVHRLLTKSLEDQFKTILGAPGVEQNLTRFFDTQFFKDYRPTDLGTYVWIAKQLRGKSGEARDQFLKSYLKDAAEARP